MLSNNSTSDTSSGADKMDAIIKCNQKLHELGLEATISLPRVILVGDQSSGKSSLVEALSLIQVPRAAGCCTQCPLKINLSGGASSDSDFECKVYIEEQYRYERSLADPSSGLAATWCRCDLSAYLYKTTKDRAEVRDLIQAAQQTILHRDNQHIQNSSTFRHGEEIFKFSPNSVRLDIIQEGLLSLSFIDLPGVIASSDKAEEDHHVPFIDALVSHYAQDLDTVILLTLPMTNDLANSKSRAVLRKLEVDDRIIPVLTKPDRAQDASRDDYLDKFFKDESSAHNHEFRVIMMDADAAVNQKEARKREEQFFARAPWKSIDASYRARLGVHNLRLYLQQVLFTKTRGTLSQNLAQIEWRLQTIAKEMEGIQPGPRSNEIPIIVERASVRLENHLRNAYNDSNEAEEGSFLNHYTNLTEKFQKALTIAHPRLVLLTLDEEKRENAAKKPLPAARTASRKRNPLDPIEISSDDDTIELSKVKTENRKVEIRNEAINADQKQTQKDDQIAHRFRLEQIRDINNKYSLIGMPHQAYPQALKEMMKISVSKWDRVLNDFMSAVSKLLSVQMLSILQSVLGEYQQFPIYITLQGWIKSYVDEAVSAEWSQAESQLAAEQTHPYTQDDKRVKALVDENLAVKRDKREYARLRIRKAERDASTTKAQKKPLTTDMLGPDDYETEIAISACVRAYYDIAATRFSDVVCQGVVARLFPACSEKLMKELRTFIGVDRPDQQQKLQDWLTEDPAVKQRREALVTDRQKLIAGKQFIMNAMAPTDGTPPSEDAASLDGATRVNDSSSSNRHSPLRTPTKRRAPDTFESSPPSTNKRLARMDQLSIHRTPSPKMKSGASAQEVYEVDSD